MSQDGEQIDLDTSLGYLLKEAATETELWIRAKDAGELLKGLEDMITFMEGAHVTPDPNAE